MAIVRFTEEELRKMPDLTDWERVRNMRDEDIDYSDIPETTDEQCARAIRGNVSYETLWKIACEQFPEPTPEPPKVPITVYVEPTIFATFRKKSGKNWQNRLNSSAETWLRQAAMA